MQSPNVDAAVACRDVSDSSGNRANGCMPETLGDGRKQRDDAIDGEVFRPPLFTPERIFDLNTPCSKYPKSLWVKPGSEDQSHNPVGFLIEIAWQEDYLARTGLPQKRTPYMSDIVDHYNQGVISQFLTADTNVLATIENGDFNVSTP